MSTDHNLKLSIAQLAQYSSSDWNKFLQEYRVYCDGITSQLVSSQTDSLQVAQGRARHAVEFLRILEDSLKTAEQVKNKGK